MPKKVCNQLGCNALVVMSERYCAAHKHDVAKFKNDNYNKYRRNQEHQKFHNSKEWKALRKVVLERSGGICLKCSQFDMIVKADVVDHIVPIAQDYSRRLDITNLQPLCHPCHNRKTAEDEALKGRGL